MYETHEKQKDYNVGELFFNSKIALFLLLINYYIYVLRYIILLTNTIIINTTILVTQE